LSQADGSLKRKALRGEKVMAALDVDFEKRDGTLMCMCFDDAIDFRRER
jgi:hypothetical protein